MKSGRQEERRKGERREEGCKGGWIIKTEMVYEVEGGVRKERMVKRRWPVKKDIKAQGKGRRKEVRG